MQITNDVIVCLLGSKLSVRGLGDLVIHHAENCEPHAMHKMDKAYQTHAKNLLQYAAGEHL